MSSVRMIIWRRPSALDDKAWGELENCLPDSKRHFLQRFGSPARARSFLGVHALFELSLQNFGLSEEYRTTYGAEWESQEDLSAAVGYCGFSHADDTLASIISNAGPVGIDVEVIGRKNRKYADLVESFFSPRERREFSQLAECEHESYFLSRWTLKESYLKAKGVGISSLGLRTDFVVPEERSVNSEPSLYLSRSFFLDDVVGAVTLTSGAKRNCESYLFDYKTRSFTALEGAVAEWSAPVEIRG